MRLGVQVVKFIFVVFAALNDFYALFTVLEERSKKLLYAYIRGVPSEKFVVSIFVKGQNAKKVLISRK